MEFTDVFIKDVKVGNIILFSGYVIKVEENKEHLIRGGYVYLGKSKRRIMETGYFNHCINSIILVTGATLEDFLN